MKRNILLRLGLSAAVSLLALGLVFALVSHSHPGVSTAALLETLRHALPGFVALYAACQLGQAALRAGRARRLIRKGSVDGRVPGGWHLLWVTLARNMFVDMLPARLGELSYVGMLNRGYNLGAEVCLSSLAVGLVFDFLALLVVLAVSIPAATQGMGLLGSLMVLAVVCGVGYAGLFHLLPWGVRWVRRSWPRSWLAWRPFAALLGLAESTADSVDRVRKAGVLGSVLALSAGIRAFKYTGMYCLFQAVTRPLWPTLSDASPWAVLVALIAAEGASSLPVPTFMSFGTYEGGGLAALRVLGFPLGDSMIAMFSLHVLSQMVDYGLGMVGYGVFSCMAPAAATPGSVPRTPARNPARWPAVARWPWVVALVLGGALFAAVQVRDFRKQGALKPPPEGVPVPVSPVETRLQQRVLSEFRGRVVWSSNRGGNHDLWMLTYPGGALSRLTSHPHTETYPRFSPDGRRIAFCRSRQPWVSQRNPVPWDTVVLDLDTKTEHVVATNAFTPAWTPDGRGVVFVRDGTSVLCQFLDSPEAPPTVLAEADREPFAADTVFQTPSPGPQGAGLALTLRGGRQRGTVLLLADGTLRQVAGGCQLGWKPDGTGLVQVDHGGQGKNAFFAYDPATSNRTLWFDSPGAFSHEYFPRVSRNGKWLAYGAAAEGHEHDAADYEVFLWRTGTPSGDAARLTFHTGNDCWPDVIVDE